MSARSKVAGAAVTAVAPEAKLAGAAAGSGGKPGGKAASQRAQIDAIKAKRPPAPPAAPQQPAPAGGPPQLPAFMTDQTGSPSWWPDSGKQATANAGGGFLLGLFAWALGLAYLRGGGDEVKALLRAKFLNQVSGG